MSTALWGVLSIQSMTTKSAIHQSIKRYLFCEVDN